jgi:hypothetical protein
MHASLAFLNGAGTRTHGSGPQHRAFWTVLNLLCTTHRPAARGARGPNRQRTGRVIRRVPLADAC